MIEEQATKSTTGLNPRQTEAVGYEGGPLLIVAGAGSGKTRVITHRIARMIERGTKPWNILALTFTNKAAAEMKERAEKIVGDPARHVTLCTFHSFCHRVLRADGDKTGLRNGFTVYDDSDQLSLTKRVMRGMNLPDNSKCTAEAAHNFISYAKNMMERPGKYLSPSHPLGLHIDNIHQLYEKALIENNAVDFDNLMLKTIELFEQHPETLERYRKKYTHILVDEYQDTNRAQFVLLHHLAGRTGNITVVGDQDQSIYGWRGADISNIISFEKSFLGASTIYLEQNYRSTQRILNAANSLISNNSGKRSQNLWSELGDGEPVRLHLAFDERDEAAFIADEIEHLASLGKYSHGDIALLMRTRAQSRVFEESFGVRALPFQVVGITGFYQRKEIKDVIAYLKLIQNPWDFVALARIINVPRRGIGEKSLEKIIQSAQAYSGTLFDLASSDAAEELPPKARGFMSLMCKLRDDCPTMLLKDFIRKIVIETGYREHLIKLDREEATSRLENVDELLSIVAEMEKQGAAPDLDTFLSRVLLQSDIDTLQDTNDTVKIMTLHSAKGLEFPVVFLAGLEENLLPHASSMYDRSQQEEERRLCYVGMTRAKERLYLTAARSRLMFGSTRQNDISRFTKDIGPENFDSMSESSMHAGRGGFFDDPAPVARTPINKKETEQKQAPRPKLAPEDFSAGDKVHHTLWGKGMVVSIKDDEISVAFPGQGVKRLIARFAPLTKI